MKKEIENGTDLELDLITKDKTAAKKQSLYAIEQDYLILSNKIEEAEGELTPELEEALKINEKDLQKKSIGYLEIIKSKEAFNGLIDAEIKRLQAMKKKNNNLVDRLKSNLLGAVELFGEYTVGTVTFGTRKTSRLEITDEDAIKKEFKISKVTTSIDKAAIKKAIKDGEEVKGAKLINGFNLNIK